MNGPASRKKILIVDDDPAITNMLDKLIKAHGYDTLTAQDGLQALNAARAEKPDLILLDVMLPGMDGYKVCRWIKFDQQLKKIPVMIRNDSAAGHQFYANRIAWARVAGFGPSGRRQKPAINTGKRVTLSWLLVPPRLTSRMSPQDELLAFECGADAFVTKAVKTDVILSQMKSLLEL